VFSIKSITPRSPEPLQVNPRNPYQKWMRLAIELAEKGRYTASPNPMVGACVVKKNRVIAQGYHQKYGAPHAEINALKKAGSRSRGATLYVTLEPCSSWGKTPPCTTEIIRSRVRRVVIGATDPNPQNHRGGIRALKKAGIQVQTGILAAEVQRQNESFFKYMQTGLPFVTLKMAQTLDGKIATCTGSSRWISSPPAREFVHRLRAEQDAVLVGKNTLLTDNPFLSPRVKIKNKNPQKPWRVVLANGVKLSSRARIFKGKQLTFLVVSEKGMPNNRNEKEGSRVYLPVSERKGRLNLRELLKKLAKLGVAKMLIEGGGETAWSFLQANLVDKVFWVVAPKIIGGRTAKTSVEGEGIQDLDHSIRFKSMNVSSIGSDLLIEGRL